MVVGDGAVSVAKVPEGVVYQLSEDDLRVVGSRPIGADPERISLGGGRIWVANTTERAVSWLGQETGARRRLFADAEPTFARYDNGLLWIGARPSPRPLAAIEGPELRIAPGYAVGTEPAQPKGRLEEQLVYATCANLLAYPDSAGPEGGRLRPEVAAAMPVVSQGGRQYTFRVRSGFRFSPPANEAVTAETFRHTIERALSPSSADTRSQFNFSATSSGSPAIAPVGRRISPASQSAATPSHSR